MRRMRLPRRTRIFTLTLQRRPSTKTPDGIDTRSGEPGGITSRPAPTARVGLPVKRVEPTPGAQDTTDRSGRRTRTTDARRLAAQDADQPPASKAGHVAGHTR